jgi:hypothetical protein
MDIKIKEFNVEMEVKNNGIELEVRNPDGTHRGDLVITKTKLEWCEGRRRPGNGVSITWYEFIEWMNSDEE